MSYQHAGIIIVESASASHVWSSFPKYNALIQSAAASPLIQVSVHRIIIIKWRLHAHSLYW